MAGPELHLNNAISVARLDGVEELQELLLSWLLREVAGEQRQVGVLTGHQSGQPAAGQQELKTSVVLVPDNYLARADNIWSGTR